MKAGNRVIIGMTRDYTKPESAQLVPEYGIVLEIEEAAAETRFRNLYGIVVDQVEFIEGGIKPKKVQSLLSGAIFWRPTHYRDIGDRREA